jgi:transcriptional regulator with XRE-family HTH domain
MSETSGAPVGRRLREIRLWRGLSLRAVAELVGVSASYLSLIERGERPVDKRSTLEARPTARQVAGDVGAGGVPRCR